jgi:hypothetical protein
MTPSQKALITIGYGVSALLIVIGLVTFLASLFGVDVVVAIIVIILFAGSALFVAWCFIWILYEMLVGHYENKEWEEEKQEKIDNWRNSYRDSNFPS